MKQPNLTLAALVVSLVVSVTSVLDPHCDARAQMQTPHGPPPYSWDRKFAGPASPDHGGAPTGPGFTLKPRSEQLKSDFEKMKRDVAELSKLVQSLQKDLEKSDENILSVTIIDKPTFPF